VDVLNRPEMGIGLIVQSSISILPSRDVWVEAVGVGFTSIYPFPLKALLYFLLNRES
jgi:hypothetical protein